MHRFSHQQVDAACAGFPDSGIVGRGGFGPVFRGRFLGQDVAVKRLDGYGLQGLPNFLKEVQVTMYADLICFGPSCWTTAAAFCSKMKEYTHHGVAGGSILVCATCDVQVATLITHSA